MKILPKILVFWILPLLFTEAAIGGENEKTERGGNYNAKYYGVIESMPENSIEGIWIVNDREILVTKDTKIEEEYGKAAVGAYVEVEGDYLNKKFTAYKIEIKMDKSEKKGD